MGTYDRSENILNDQEAISLALKAPLPARLSQPQSGMVRKYRLEDRLNGAGVMGSIAPPPDYAIRAMTPNYAPRSGNRAMIMGLALIVLGAFTGLVVYRDMHRAPATVSAPASE